MIVYQVVAEACVRGTALTNKSAALCVSANERRVEVSS